MKPQRRAFTLVELLVVIGIIAVLIGILIPVVSRIRVQAQTTNSTQQISRITQAIANYHLEFGAYPGLLPNAAFNNPAGYFDAPGGANDMKTPGQFTQAEDLCLALLGGLSSSNPAPAPPNPVGPLLLKKDFVGSGPVTYNPVNPGKKTAYMANTEADVSTPGILLKDDGRMSAYTYVTDSEAPEFIDQYAEPRPLIYIRANGVRTGNVNQIVSNVYDPTCHYNLSIAKPYLNGTDPKETLAKGASDQQVKDFFTTGERKDPNNPAGAAKSVGTAKFAGSYIIFSAGVDRKFGTDDDIVYGGGGGGK